MTSLSAHFGRPGEHDRLPFHPRCPRCREERLEGALSVAPLASRRAQAAITAGVLAFTSVTPATAFATGSGGEVEGTAAPGQVTPGVESETGFARSSDAETPLNDAALAPADEAKDADAAAPAAAAPSTSAPAPPEASAPQPTGDAPPADVQEVSPQPAESAATAPAAAEEAGAPATPANRAAVANEKAIKRVKRVHRRAAAKRRVVRAKVVAAPAVAAVAPAAPAPARARVPAATHVAAVVEAPARPSRPARAGDESHVVARGESLWSIAVDVLGDDASPARIAREVNRLWELNTERIGTGNRDLLMAGTRLAL